MFDLQQWLKDTVPVGGEHDFMQPIRNRIRCKDGFIMSVQASSYHYCEPRVDGCVAYASVEVGFPSAKELLLAEYAEDWSTPTKTVYGYVPVETVEFIIEKHGGFDKDIPFDVLNELEEKEPEEDTALADAVNFIASYAMLTVKHKLGEYHDPKLALADDGYTITWENGERSTTFVVNGQNKTIDYQTTHHTAEDGDIKPYSDSIESVQELINLWNWLYNEKA